MADIPHEWREYARKQIELSLNCRVDGWSWGIEAGLDRILDAKARDELLTTEDVDRAMNAARNREKHRGKLRLTYLDANQTTRHPEHALEARDELRQIQSCVSRSDWNLLSAIGVGRGYGEIAVLRKMTPGSLRVRVVRLRNTCRRLNPSQIEEVQCRPTCVPPSTTMVCPVT